MTIREILNNLDSKVKNPPATNVEIEDCAQKLNVVFCDDYIEFLLNSNGAEGFTPEDHAAGYFRLYSTDRIVERNCGYEIPSKFPGYIAIGTNGGGELFLMDTKSPKQPVLMVHAIEDDFEYAIAFGESFFDFLKGICLG